MYKELVKERTALDQKIGRQTTQVLIEGDLIVPDSKPDMSVVLQADAGTTIDRIELSQDRINFMGKLDISLLYLARGSQSPVHSMNVTMSIDDFINMDGVTKETWVEAQAEIAHIDYRMINDRKVNYRAIVDVTASASNTEVHEAVTNIKEIPENQMLKSSISITKTIDNKTEKIIAKNLLMLEAGKPNIREILQTSVTIANKDCKVQGGRVNVSGELVVAVLYRGDNENSILELSEHEVPFSGAIEIANAKDDMYADVTLVVSDQYIQLQQDEDGEDRALNLEVTINSTVKLTNSQNIEILEDAYCINKTLDIKKSPIKYSKLVCHNKNQSPIKEVVTLDESCPDILQIFSAKGKSFVHEIKVIEDKVIVEGSIEANALYIAESDEAPLYSYKTVIPYRQVIETKGATSGMEVSVVTSVEHVSFNMLSGREMELRFLLSHNTNVYREKEVNIITDIEFFDMDKAALESMASMTIYVVQQGDDLWKIAKKYNTAIDELLAVNEIENPNKVFAGQKLLVLKKVE